MPLPPALTKFTTASPQIASFDWLDLATGTGYKQFYLIDTITGAGTTSYTITPQINYGHDGFTPPADPLDIDFDINFEVPITLEGDAILSVWFGTASSDTYTIQYNFKHVDKFGTETQIGTEVSDSILIQNRVSVFTGKYNIPLTTFGAGESLRLIITTTAAGNNLSVLTDPKNRTTLLGFSPATFPASQSTINLPIKIS